ncbi:MBL fold metallo-hydrolase RNA specificity domain-containing protein [Flaviaesturariibacter aridisoli]|uniref:MBL fold metallo-hydrolase n=1 Tax=Flaviaesturariibacter aridisoli TaxID=2545761 RepID=A0A4R4E082_9BACT|nr:MBL fold metallo-hydrolase [Flaviaesturariibacter aridisoli]TCZ68596.1 MBL fold metallo-hydrolase [Flaviaesturariibacter aridisoli]
MKIAFHGAARTVTGSKHLLTLSNGKKVLLDCGLFQGMGRDTDAMNRTWGFEPSEVDVLILSHAHIDHSGLIPKLVKEGFGGKIFCTDATEALATLLLEDSAEIQENDVRAHNKSSKAQGKPLLEPLYTVDDAKACAGRFVARPYNEWFPVLEGVECRFTDAGHILGSACVHLRVQEKGKPYRITFSGDVGRYRDVILRSPGDFDQADCIIMESTYGDKLHENVSTSVDQLLHWIEHTCIEKGGKLIVPAFSLGRTQELLYALNQLELENRLPALDYFVDSPLSTDITAVIKRFPQYFNKTIQRVMQTDDDPFHFKGLRFTKSVEDSKMLNYLDKPCVIISASGMAEAGRVKHHISNNIENSHNSILLTGYCEPHSLGGRLMAGEKEVGIYGIRHEVHAEVGAIRSMSAHGDYEDLMQWLHGQEPREVQKFFLVHGEYEVQQELKRRLVSKGFRDVQIPERHFEVGIG